MNASIYDRTGASAFASVDALAQVGCGQALHLGRLGGELTVVSGRVWLTRDGDLGDHLLEAGERLVLAVDDNAVIEPWDAGATASVRWNPRHQTFIAALLAEPLRGLAFIAGKLAAGSAALARQAASSARWAEGRIDAQGGRATASASYRSIGI